MMEFSRGSSLIVGGFYALGAHTREVTKVAGRSLAMIRAKFARTDFLRIVAVAGAGLTLGIELRPTPARPRPRPISRRLRG